MSNVLIGYEEKLYLYEFFNKRMQRNYIQRSDLGRGYLLARPSTRIHHSAYPSYSNRPTRNSLRPLSKITRRRRLCVCAQGRGLHQRHGARRVADPAAVRQLHHVLVNIRGQRSTGGRQQRVCARPGVADRVQLKPVVHKPAGLREHAAQRVPGL